MAEPIRLQKYFTDCGILSRRAAETEIAAGNVLVNGRPAAVGTKIVPGEDTVTYRGKPVLPRRAEQKHLYLMLNKPRGFVTTMKDEKGRKTVSLLVSDLPARVYPVGRLDMDSEGLLLFSDDGEFTNHLTHPRHEIPKIYRVTLTGEPTAEQMEILRSPLELDGYRIQPVKVVRAAPCELEMTLFEGRNRQIRRMCEAAGLRITRLCRIAVGKLSLGDLAPGKWRFLDEAEVRYLFPGAAQTNNEETERIHHAQSITD